MGRVTLLAQEENGRDWGQGHFIGNQGVGWLKEGKRAEGHIRGQELQSRDADATGELFREPTKFPHLTPSLGSLWDKEEGLV